MHVFFSGIGGVGIGPAALIAKQAGYEVSGSDAREGQVVEELRQKGISIHVGQNQEQLAKVHSQKPIDWFVYTAALPPDHSELVFCRDNGIITMKQYEFINQILTQHNLELVAIAGTHGKTTTTAMVIWLFEKLKIPTSYSLGGRVANSDMGHFNPRSHFIVVEADEFNRKFLVLKPRLSIISGLGYDHHEVYPTRDDYNQAFRDFLNQSQSAILWRQDLEILNKSSFSTQVRAEDEQNPQIDQIKLAGLYNRRDGWLAIKAVQQLTDTPLERLVEVINAFPGVSRRFEPIAPNLYSDDAHTPEKIIGCMSVAKELAAHSGQEIIVLYEPLTNRRMHYTAKDHSGVFEGASRLYWLPSYLAREDPEQPILTPEELIKNLSPQLQKIARPAKKNQELQEIIATHLQKGDMVVAMAGGGADSLDTWLRQKFSS